MENITNNINVLVIFETKPESTTIFAALLTSISNELPNVSGCIHALARVCTENPQRFIIFEEWESQDAHAVHIAKVVASGAWEDIAKHLTSAPVSHYYQHL